MTPKRILAYGDSNVWGQTPEKNRRYTEQERWTALLQSQLGPDYTVIEEGLGGRTTDLDYPDKPWRNGRVYLRPCLASQNPMDLVILLLGTNDLKTTFQRTAAEITLAVGRLLDDIEEYAQTRSGAPVKIILLGPAALQTEAPTFDKLYNGVYDEISRDKGRELTTRLQELAETRSIVFLDLSPIAEPGEDGLHFSLQAHKNVAEALLPFIRTILD